MDLVNLMHWEVQHHSVSDTQRALEWAVRELLRLRSLITEYVDTIDSVGDYKFNNWWAVDSDQAAEVELSLNNLRKAVE